MNNHPTVKDLSSKIIAKTEKNFKSFGKAKKERALNALRSNYKAVCGLISAPLFSEMSPEWQFYYEAYKLAAETWAEQNNVNLKSL